MPLISTVINYFRGDSPKINDVQSKMTTRNKYLSPKQSPSLQRKVYPDQRNSESKENEVVSNRKKRTWDLVSQDDEKDEIVAPAKKTRFEDDSTKISSSTSTKASPLNESKSQDGFLFNDDQQIFDDRNEQLPNGHIDNLKTPEKCSKKVEKEPALFDDNNNTVLETQMESEISREKKCEKHSCINIVQNEDIQHKEVEQKHETPKNNVFSDVQLNMKTLDHNPEEVKCSEMTMKEQIVEDQVPRQNSDVGDNYKTNVNTVKGDQEVPNDDEQDDVLLMEQQVSDGVLTKSMVDQEKELHKRNEEEEKEIVNKAMEEWKSTLEQQRYSRLQHLLDKSNAYSQFLLERIEKQKKYNEKAELKAAKKTDQNVPEQKQPRKSKASSKYDIKDYVDPEMLKKNVQSSPSGKENKDQLPESQVKATDDSQAKKSSYVAPALLTGGSLRDYQIEGVEWLKVLFENGVNGILADEMGLGKTIQCITLLAHLMENGVSGPFLVAAPLSTLPNWVSEFKKFTPTVSAILYHGTPTERANLRKMFHKLKKNAVGKSFPVVVTSYEIIIIDRKYLAKYLWKYLIVDEGHRIKNLKCKLIRELKTYPAANRLLLTGTPLQNNLSELWSLLNFLLPDIFDDLNSFQAWFDFSAISESGGNEKIIAQEREHHVLERLHAILTPFLLRRLKSDVNIDMPRKKEVIVYAPFTQKQDDLYKLFLDKTRCLAHFKKKVKEETQFSPNGRTRRRCRRTDVRYDIYDDDRIDYEELMKKLQDAENEEKERKSKENAKLPPEFERNVKLTNVLMALRKTCNHPYLLEYPLVVETGDYRIDEELITCCGKTLILDQLLAALKERGHKVLLFSQMSKMLDILQDFCYLRDYQFSRIDGDTKFYDRQEQIDNFNTDPSIFVFLLSTRAGGLGLNLTAADTVILFDSDWNPQQDLQAQDRCHRIGQTRPVIVYRFLTANTIDQRIVERASEKRKLEKMVIHKGKFKGTRNCEKIGVKEMMELLESPDHRNIVNDNNTKVLSKDALEKLLDRSDLYDNAKSVTNNENQQESEHFKIITNTEKI